MRPRPTPALTTNPASMAPVERAPSKYSSVRTTDAAQLGIRPTIAETTTERFEFAEMNEASASSPTPSITISSASETRNMNNVTCNVCTKELFAIAPKP